MLELVPCLWYLQGIYKSKLAGNTLRFEFWAASYRRRDISTVNLMLLSDQKYIKCSSFMNVIPVLTSNNASASTQQPPRTKELE